MTTAEFRRALLLDLHRLQRTMVTRRIPKRFRYRRVSKLRVKYVEVDPNVWLMDFHARLPAFIAKVEKGQSVERIAYSTGMVVGFLIDRTTSRTASRVRA